MEQLRITIQQLRTEASIHRRKVSEVAKELIDYCESKKTDDCLMVGPIDHNPFQEKKSCALF